MTYGWKEFKREAKFEFRLILIIFPFALALTLILVVFQSRAYAQTLLDPQRGYILADPVRENAIGLALYSGTWAVSKGDNCDNTNIAPGENITLWMVEGFKGFGVVAPITNDGTIDMSNSCDVRVEQLVDTTPCFTDTFGVCDIAAEQ